MKDKKLSILVPIYGTEKYIANCAHSLFRQNYDNIEYIFVNDCTKDNSIEILNQVILQYPKVKDKVKIINHEKNFGLARSRLTGINNATGDYIWCIDSDDCIDEHALDILKKYLINDFDMLFFDYTVSSLKCNNAIRRNKISVKSLLSMRTPYPIWSVIIKRALIVRNKIYPIEGIDFSEDYVMVSRLIVSCKNYINIHKTLYYYNVMNPASYMHNIDKNKIYQSCVGALNVYTFLKKERKGLSAFYYYIALRYIQLYRVEKNLPIFYELSNCMYSINYLLTFILISLRDSKNYDRLLKVYRVIVCRVLDF